MVVSQNMQFSLRTSHFRAKVYYGHYGHIGPVLVFLEDQIKNNVTSKL